MIRFSKFWRNIIITVLVLKKFRICFSQMQCQFSTIFERNLLTRWKSFFYVSKKRKTKCLHFTVKYNKNKFSMVNYSKSCPQNVMHLQWLYPLSTNYNQNPLTDISTRQCQGVKMKKNKTLVLTADIIPTNIRIIKNLK